MDLTKHRKSTFFDRFGLVVHVNMDPSFCAVARCELHDGCKAVQPEDELRDAPFENGVSFVTIEGPQYLSGAEVEDLNGRGFGLMGMTSDTEAKLMREAGICYAVLAVVTDGYKSKLTAEIVEKNFKASLKVVKRIIAWAVVRAEVQDCACHHALDHALHSGPGLMNAEQREIWNALRRQG